MINIAIIFGGKSVEHEVSIITAMQTIAQIKMLKGYNAVPIYISKEGKWLNSARMDNIDNFKDLKSLKKKATPVVLVKGEKPETANLISTNNAKTIARIDIAFPIMHGSGGEDGSLQGLLEIMEIPYIGSAPLASAITMDKIMTKFVLERAGVNIPNFIWFYSETAKSCPNAVLDNAESALGYPMIVKPADIGSSIGVSPATNRDQLAAAINHASQFTTRVLVEEMIEDASEINISVLGDAIEYELSVCERPLSQNEFLTYEDKYMSHDSNKGMASTKREIPANISPEAESKIRQMAEAAFVIIDCAGVNRIDFFLDAKDQPYLCEINSIPGSLAYYLWEATGLSFQDLLVKLIHIAHRQRRRAKALTRTTNYNLLNKDNLLGIKK